MLFYVPPMLPVRAEARDGIVGQGGDRLFADVDAARAPLQYLASLFGAGDTAPVRDALRKQQAVRWYRRAITVGDVSLDEAGRRLAEAGSTADEAEAIYRLTALCTVDQRFVLPGGRRELAPDNLNGAAGQ
jgi:nitrate reductase beta subunit